MKLSPCPSALVPVTYKGAGHLLFAEHRRQKQGCRWFCSAVYGRRGGSSGPGGWWGSRSQWRGWWGGSGNLQQGLKAGSQVYKQGEQHLLPSPFLNASVLCCAVNQSSEQKQSPWGQGKRENRLWRYEDCPSKTQYNSNIQQFRF